MLGLRQAGVRLQRGVLPSCNALRPKLAGMSKKGDRERARIGGVYKGLTSQHLQGKRSSIVLCVKLCGREVNAQCMTGDLPNSECLLGPRVALVPAYIRLELQSIP